MKKLSRYDIRKNELFEEISELINRDGIENLTVRYICKELDISTGTFYHYFPEKGDISRIMFSGIDRFFETEVIDNLTDDEVNNLIIFSESYGAFVVKNGVEISRNISMAPLKHKDKGYLTEERSIFIVLHDILKRGEEKGQFCFDEPVVEMARMIMILLRGYCSDWAKTDGAYDVVGRIGVFIRIFIESLKLC